MTACRTLQGWVSTSAPSVHAAELIRSCTASRSLKSDLVGIAEHVGSARFVIATIHDRDLPNLGQAVDSFYSTGRSARLCLAGSRAMLAKVDTLGLDNDHVGLMLDDADIETPWADLIWDRIEAVRFASSLVVHAARDMRTACAMESMLGLAREIGLRTLGSCEVTDSASVSGHYDFDFLPVAEGAHSTQKFREALPYSAQARGAVEGVRQPMSR